MPRRSYRQFCSLASALDRVGERWTLLVLRQLLTGPKRFSDLLADLPGIGTNLLSARLRQLERDGLVRRTVLPKPASTAVYELTEAGRALDPAITALARWGSRFLEPPGRGTTVRAGWLMVAMKAAARPEAVRGKTRIFQYEIEGEIFHLRVGLGEVEARQGAAESPDFIARMPLSVLVAIARRELDPLEAVRKGAVELEGSEAAYRLSAEVFDRGRETARLGRPSRVGRAAGSASRPADRRRPRR
jgi:DNA-binding HxlR family transcriptional regulator/putative sterol carrier protein